MPIVSFRVTAEVHERLLKLAEERDQTLTALMQETTSHIVERTQTPTAIQIIKDLQAKEVARQWPPRSAIGSRLKKDKK